jgi:hypothetical protein
MALNYLELELELGLGYGFKLPRTEAGRTEWAADQDDLDWTDIDLDSRQLLRPLL